MKLIGNRESILAAFNVVASVVPTRSPKPILQNVKIEAEKSGITLVATDMEVAIRMEVPDVEVEVPGDALVPVSRFGLILRESPDEKLKLTADPQGTVVRGERSEFRLPGANPDEFPAVVTLLEERCHEVPARLFKELIRRTIFATDVESSRYALGGVLLEFDANRIVAVGTDGRRLAKMEGPAIAIGEHRTGDTMTIVPTRAMQLMDRALVDNDAEIRVASRANDILVKSQRATIYSRLVEGRFPKWREVFPQRPQSVRIELPVGAFYAGLRQAAIVASEDSRGVEFTFGDGTVVFSGSTAEVGQSRIEMPINYNGASVSIALDHRYVSDFLRVLDPAKNFSLEVENGEAAALFTTDDGYGYVVMPLSRDR